MAKQKRYREVSEMVKETSESKEFVQAFEKRLQKRELIKTLMIMRAAQGLSQKDMATRMNCSQSRISKLENSNDADLRFGDVLEYASALGFQNQLLFLRKETTLAELVKFHFFQTKEAMERLLHLANTDPDIGKGIACFFGEACFNFVNMLVEKSQALPKAAQEEVPLIQMINEQLDTGPDQEELTDCQHAHRNGAPVSV